MSGSTKLLSGTALLLTCTPALGAVVATAQVEARVGGSALTDSGSLPGQYTASLSSGSGGPAASADLSWTTTPSTTTFAFSGTASGDPSTLAESELIVQFTLASSSTVWITWNLSNVANRPVGNLAGWSISDPSNPTDPYLFALAYADGDAVPTTTGGVGATAIGAGPTGFVGVIPAGTWIFAVGIQLEVAVSGGFAVAITLPAPSSGPLLLAAAISGSRRRRRR